MNTLEIRKMKNVFKQVAATAAGTVVFLAGAAMAGLGIMAMAVLAVFAMAAFGLALLIAPFVAFVGNRGDDPVHDTSSAHHAQP